jgi:hypothetical protein
LQTESAQPVEEPKIIDVADIPKPVEAEAGAEELPALVERGRITLEQFSDIFANIEKAMARETAEKAAAESGNIVPDMRPNIPIAPEDVTPEMLASQAKKESDAQVATAAAESVAAASAARAAEAPAPVVDAPVL